MKPIRKLAICVWLVLFTSMPATTAVAQTRIFTPSPPANASQVVPTQIASLSDYLVSRLRATTEDQRDYVREIVKLVEANKLDRRLVLALERYAHRKNPYFPLPVYERALRVEAAKRGVVVPTMKEIVARNGASTARAIRDSRLR